MEGQMLRTDSPEGDAARHFAALDRAERYFERRTDAEARQRQLVRQLEALGHKVILEPAA